MLQRTVSRTEGGGGPRISWRPVFLVALALAVLGGFYALLPAPGPRLRPSGLSADELRVRVLSHRRLEDPAPTRTEKKRAALGRKLFADAHLSPDGRACESCHVPERAFMSGSVVPSLVDVAQNGWFMKDGRADSLAAAALLELEHPARSGSTRVAVVRAIRERYAAEFEDAFGAWPAALKKADLPRDATPAPAELKLPIELSAYALASLGSFKLMTDVLKTAQAARLAPAVELARRAGATRPAPGAEATVAWEKLTPEEKQGVDRVFADAGLALAAYLSGITAKESPFDRFAARVAQGKLPEDALDTGFGERELKGLGLFDGSLGCGGCHSGPTFSDQRFHNLGLPSLDETVDLGRAVAVMPRDADPFTCFGTLLRPDDVGAWPVTCERPAWAETDLTALVHAFRTPSLRNVSETAPYMHDGRFAELGDVLDFYSELPGKPAFGRRHEGLVRLDLTHEERQALLAFLGALSSPVRDVRTGQSLSVKP